MKIMYDIATIKEVEDGSIRIEARFFEGDFQLVDKVNEDGNSIPTQEFVRGEHLWDIAKYFPAETTREQGAAWFTAFMAAHSEGREPLWN